MRVIDCDAHVEESVGSWSYLDPEFSLLRPMTKPGTLRIAAQSHEAAGRRSVKLPTTVP